MENPTTVATLLALALGLVKIVESLIVWTMKRFSGKEELRPTVVELGPEASRMLRDMSGQVATIHSIQSKTDDLGAPLVYGPRYELHQVAAALADVDKKVEDVAADVADAIKSKKKE